MEIETIKVRIKEIINASAKLDPIKIEEKAHLHKDLKIDSLTLLEIALTIDQEFKTNFSDDELLMMESVQRAAEMVVGRLNGSSRALPL